MVTLDEVILFIHILGATIWVGGTLSLGIVAAAMGSMLRDQPALYSRVMSRVARSLGWTMWFALIVTVLTGLYNLTWFLPVLNWSAITSSPWLEAKIFLVFFLVLASGVHSFVLGPSLRKRAERHPPAAGIARWRRWDRGISILSLALTLGVLFAAVMLAN